MMISSVSALVALSAASEVTPAVEVVVATRHHTTILSPLHILNLSRSLTTLLRSKEVEAMVEITSHLQAEVVEEEGIAAVITHNQDILAMVEVAQEEEISRHQDIPETVEAAQEEAMAEDMEEEVVEDTVVAHHRIKEVALALIVRHQEAGTAHHHLLMDLHLHGLERAHRRLLMTSNTAAATAGVAMMDMFIATMIAGKTSALSFVSVILVGTRSLSAHSRNIYGIVR